MDWWIGFIDHLYTPLGTTAPLLISTIHRAPQHPLRIFSQPVVSTIVSSQRLLRVKILQLPRLTSSLSGEYSTIDLLSTVNSTIAPSLLSLPCRARLNCQTSTKWVPGWRPFHTNLPVVQMSEAVGCRVREFSCQLKVSLWRKDQLTTELSKSKSKSHCDWRSGSP
jgi:hypothetical protein